MAGSKHCAAAADVVLAQCTSVCRLAGIERRAKIAVIQMLPPCEHAKTVI